MVQDPSHRIQPCCTGRCSWSEAEIVFLQCASLLHDTQQIDMVRYVKTSRKFCVQTGKTLQVFIRNRYFM